MGDRDEIKRLKKENHDLKKKLYKLEMSSISEESTDSATKCYSSNNYFSFLLSKARQKSLFTRFEKYFKNSLLFSSIFRWGVLIYQYLQAGAFVIIYTAAFILIIPIILVFSALTLIVTLILRSDNTRRLLKDIKNDVVFLIPTGKDSFDRMYLLQLSSEHPESSILIVSPFFFKKTGVGEKDKMYVCYRKEGENIFILRSYFFFYFRRRLKKLQKHNITEIHTNGRSKL